MFKTSSAFFTLIEPPIKDKVVTFRNGEKDK